MKTPLYRRSPGSLGLRRATALWLYRVYRHLHTRRHPLTYLFWECTLRCNLDCAHCGSDCLRESSVKDMPLADFLQVLDKLCPPHNPAKLLLVLTGGEPLMRKDLEECGREFQRRGHPWGFVTNGYAMTRERFDTLLRAGLRSMTISLDGLQASHDRFRGRRESFRRACQSIAWAASTPGLTFDVVTCVNRETLAELPALRELLINMGVRRWRIATVFPKGRAKTNPAFQLTDEEFQSVFRFLHETRLQKRIRANYGCEGFLGAWEATVRDSPFFCRAGVNIGSVLADGSISACPSLRADYIQGNIYRDNFLQVWNERFQNMRDRSWMRTGACKTCKSWNNCQGNGLHLRDQQSGELLLCHLQRLEDAARAANFKQ